MAYRQILKFPNQSLREKSLPVAKFNSDLSQLVTDLSDTLNVEGGVGLAAPQIGVLQRIIYIRSENFTGVMINPEILESKDENILQEGCLSFPGVFEGVKRFTTVKCQYKDLQGEQHQVILKNLSAHIVQHEIEHLDGILLVDKLGTIKRDRIRRRRQKELRLQKRANGSSETPHRKKANSHLSKKEIKIRKKNRSSSKR